MQSLECLSHRPIFIAGFILLSNSSGTDIFKSARIPTAVTAEINIGFVPVKRHNPGDGVFCQWLVGVAVLLNGFVVYSTQGFPHFYPLAVVGGMLWGTGNAMVVWIIGELGLGLTILLISVSSCFVTYTVSYFGLFWTIPRPPSIEWLSFIGLILIFIGGVMISQVKNKKPTSRTSSTVSVFAPSKNSHESWTLANEASYGTMSTVLCPELSSPLQILTISSVDMKPDTKIPIPSSKDDDAIAEKSSSLFDIRRTMFVFLALLSGCFGGLCATPVIAIQDNPKFFGADSTDVLHLIFSHFFGVFLASTLIFIGYSIVKRSEPFLNPRIVLPSLSAGLVWSSGMVFYFLSVDKLSQSISGPIGSMLPGVIASAWSVFYFREIEPGRNLHFLCLAICITISGAITVGMSK
ncbi:transmembrane family of transporters domain-containing protein [Ditylenchus destructor]|uniref:Transmembrane family of transporters domain-containing protein n=1 Tax=Ditylenchus destructor TaxID=166010 RepID=A0AAD4N3F6_9BILA|nr:transmembrane family of transporters domain-containing protein [Ditylenchus destructor]